MIDRLQNRREFLQALVPTWLTANNLRIAAVSFAVYLALSWILALTRENKLGPSLKALGVVSAAVLVLWIISRLVAALVALSRRFPPVLLAFFVVLGQLVNFTAIAAYGAYLYVRGKNGDDFASLALATAIFLVLRFCDEWRGQSANSKTQSGQSTADQLS